MSVEAAGRNPQFTEGFTQDAFPETCRVPYELWLEVATYLPGEELGRLARVCRDFRILAGDRSLWELLCEKGH